MANANLIWVDPTTRTDGTALPASQIAAVNVLVSADKGNTWAAAGSVAAGAQAFSWPVPGYGTYQFKVEVVDTQTPALVSADSEIASATYAAPVLAAPATVTGLTVTIS